jgi:hypothetical protein
VTLDLFSYRVQFCKIHGNSGFLVVLQAPCIFFSFSDFGIIKQKKDRKRNITGGVETCRTDFGQKFLRDELKGVELNHRRVLNNLKDIVFGRD